MPASVCLWAGMRGTTWLSSVAVLFSLALRAGAARYFFQGPGDSPDYSRCVTVVCGFKTLLPLSKLYPSLFSSLDTQKPSLSLFFWFGQVHFCFVKSSWPVVKSRVNGILYFPPFDDKFGSDCHGSIWRASRLILTASEYSKSA